MTIPYLSHRPARLCDDCDEAPATEQWDAHISMSASHDEHLCDCCADRRRDRWMERRMEDQP